MLRRKPGQGNSSRATMSCLAVHKALFALGVTQGDEFHGATEVGGGGFEMVHCGEVQLIDAMPEEGRKERREGREGRKEGGERGA